MGKEENFKAWALPERAGLRGSFGEPSTAGNPSTAVRMAEISAHILTLLVAWSLMDLTVGRIRGWEWDFFYDVPLPVQSSGQGSSPSWTPLSCLYLAGAGVGVWGVGPGRGAPLPLLILQAPSTVPVIGFWPIKCIDLLLLVTLSYKWFLFPLWSGGGGFRLYRMTWFVSQEPLGLWQISPFKKHTAFSLHPTGHKSNLWIYGTKCMSLKGSVHRKGGKGSKTVHPLFWGHCLQTSDKTGYLEKSCIDF